MSAVAGRPDRDTTAARLRACARLARRVAADDPAALGALLTALEPVEGALRAQVGAAWSSTSVLWDSVVDHVATCAAAGVGPAGRGDVAASLAVVLDELADRVASPAPEAPPEPLAGGPRRSRLRG